MKYSDIPVNIQKEMPVLIPSVQHYIVTDYREQRQGIMDDRGGKSIYGDEWQVIVDGLHEQVACEPLEVTLH